MLSILLALAAQTSSGKLPPAPALPPPVGEEQAVLATVNALLGSFNAGNSAAMLRWVYPDGRVTSVELETKSGSVWLDLALQALFRGARLPPLHDENEPITFNFTMHYILIRGR